MKKVKPIELKRDDMVVFRLYEEKDRIMIESGSGLWSVCYKRDTHPYELMRNIINSGQTELLTLLARTVYASSVFFSQPELIPAFFELIGGLVQKETMSSDSEDEILAEQKVFHDPTPDNIKEHQKIINDES